MRCHTKLGHLNFYERKYKQFTENLFVLMSNSTVTTKCVINTKKFPGVHFLDAMQIFIRVFQNKFNTIFCLYLVSIEKAYC